LYASPGVMGRPREDGRLPMEACGDPGRLILNPKMNYQGYLGAVSCE